MNRILEMLRESEWTKTLLALSVFGLVVGGVALYIKKGTGSATQAIHEKGPAKPVLSDEADEEGVGETHASTPIQGMKTVDEELDARVERIREEVQKGVRKPASRAAVAPPRAREMCKAAEYPGLGTELSKISPQAWARVLDEYHEAKAIALSWISDERMNGNLTPELAEWMDAQTRDIRIQRPPTAEEPDLSWRGIVALSEDVKGSPLIRVGGGFTALIDRDPRRARFELVRAISQTWTGCRMAEAKLKAPWSDFLSCMGVQASSCKSGSSSEDSWAISTRVATQIASPGCRIPAFEEASAAKCYSRFPASVASAKVETETHSGE